MCGRLGTFGLPRGGCRLSYQRHALSRGALSNVCALAWARFNRYAAVEAQEQQPYDQLWEKDGTILRVQVKTAHWSRSQGCYRANTFHGGTRNVAQRYSSDHCDTLFVVSADFQRYWLLPLERFNGKVPKGLTFSAAGQYAKFEVNGFRADVSPHLLDFGDDSKPPGRPPSGMNYLFDEDSDA